MEKKFENRDFEHFVKQNADQYRMFPSEKVWKGINNTLHTRRRWYGIGLALLLLSTAAVTGIMLSPASKKQAVAESNINIASTKAEQTENVQPALVIASVNTKNKKTAFKSSPDNTQKNLFTLSPGSSKPEASSIAGNIVINKTVAKDLDVSNAPEEVLPASVKSKITEQPIKIIRKNTIAKTTIAAMKNINTGTDGSLSDKPESKEINKENVTEVVIEDNLTRRQNDVYPMSIESVVNSYKYSRASKKIVWQIHLTPSVTYRKLDDNKPFMEAARNSIGVTNIYSFYDINNLVTHKPDVGLQLGFSAGYPLTKDITIKAGLQLNISKYNIRASSSTSEVATIALNTSAGGTNTVSAISNYRNVGGYKASWLHNKYVSASVPIGAEIKLSGNRKTIVGVGATVEPTYVLGNRAYLLSTDLKNYAEFPSLTRKWNLNTGFEIFAGYNTGKLDWRIGPQVRYQVFSSFNDTYPIKEHLFDFGVKLGLTLK